MCCKGRVAYPIIYGACNDVIEQCDDIREYVTLLFDVLCGRRGIFGRFGGNPQSPRAT